MKTRQTLPDDTSGYIKKLSPFLHWLAMPGFLLLREDFGFLFFRPKRVFIPTALFAICLPILFIRNAEDRWWTFSHNLPPILFFEISGFTYFIGLGRNIWKQFRCTAQHDRYSGTSKWFPREWRTPGRNILVKILGDPLIIFLGARLMVRFEFPGFALLLFAVSIAMVLSEVMNWWFSIRNRTKFGDMRFEAEEAGRNVVNPGEVANPYDSSRKPAVHRPRNPNIPNIIPFPAAIEERPIEELHASVLKLHPPYTMEEVKRNFTELHHWDEETANREHNQKVEAAYLYFLQKLKKAA